MSKMNLPTRFEELIDRELDRGARHLRMTGSSSFLPICYALSLTSSKEFNVLPHLVVVPRSADVWRFIQTMTFFDSERKVAALPAFDVRPYDGLSVKRQIPAERVRFAFEAQRAKSGDIFVASVESLLQKTLSYQTLSKRQFHLRPNTDMKVTPDLLASWGYESTTIVEDVGQFSQRGGLIDLFSPAHDHPVRIELFGDTVESLRFFSVADQRSLGETPDAWILPAKECVWDERSPEDIAERIRMTCEAREVPALELEEGLRAATRKLQFDGMDFLLNEFLKSPASPLDHFSSPLQIWWADHLACTQAADHLYEELKAEYADALKSFIRPPWEKIYSRIDELPLPEGSRQIEMSALEFVSSSDRQVTSIPYPCSSVLEVSQSLTNQQPGSQGWISNLQSKLSFWEKDDFAVVIASRGQGQSERLKLLLEKLGYQARAHKPESTTLHRQDLPGLQSKSVTLVGQLLPESLRLQEERIVFLRDEDLLGKKSRSRQTSSREEFSKKAQRLNFGDLKPGDCVVHVQHGIGVYEGLKVMQISGAESEFIQISYKDKDRLYLPVYRVGQLQKYSGASNTAVLDKLGGSGWEKTKAKVRHALKDLADELLRLYAKRSQLHREPFLLDEDKVTAFEAAFPFDETEDQIRAINDLLKDLQSTRPMDRLICGDVGFGKTEVAMRAAFVAATNRKQVAVIAPTTVLSFQHFETFKKRFAGWPIQIAALNRFIEDADAKKILQKVKAGEIDILIGTHRLLSKDVVFKDLGLMIVDEEQKFGVAHKEKLRKMQTNVDTLSMSATPIPRTLNMSLVGIRDLSLINTPPMDRLPTRTFLSKWDNETIRKAIQNEVSRGGQVYFIHNRVQSIYGLADELRQLLPDVRMRVAHGQMEEHELEKAMLAFFNHEIDVLICTAIVESGMDVSRANTMFIDQAQLMGLSQLYQLRGRVGRSKQRAYCYLLLPRGKQLDKDAQERLKVIQDNTALGSGIHIAQYDLEMRGAGNLLGDAQSGHIESVGYEMYMDLLNEAVAQLKGDPLDETIDPDINLRIPAMIPEKYIADIRIRLSYYKALADIQSPEELDSIESELRDQFGEPPEPTMNLMGLMLIRSLCKKLSVKDLSAGPKNVSLIFTEKTKLRPQTVIQLAMRENKKYSITPDQRLNIRMNSITWPAVYEELSQLVRLIDN